MTSRPLCICAVLAAFAAGCPNPDVGKACAKKADCGGELICDVHDGKGTCQEPHGHGSAGDTEDTAHGSTAHEDTAHHGTTAHEDTTHGGTTEDTSSPTTADDTAAGGQVGDACETAEDCAGELECDVHDGAGTCQEPHDH